jgi:DNA-binding MarR family transcriptional regulator
VIVFFHVCERDGIGIKELIFVSGFSESLVSRAVDRLARDGSRSGLVRVVKHPKDRRRRFVYLTEKGHALRDELAEMLSL